MCFSLMYCRRWGKIVYQATKEILPDNLTVVFRLKVRLAKKIVSTIRLTKLDFCNKVTGKMRQTT